jgi:hypothetical protein
MKMFIITGIAMTLIVGVFLALMSTSEMKSGWKRNIVTIIIAFAIGFGISGLLTAEHKADVKTWNNGYCAECGGEWHLTDVVKGHNNGSTRYYWECVDCYNVIDTVNRFK